MCSFWGMATGRDRAVRHERQSVDGAQFSRVVGLRVGSLGRRRRAGTESGGVWFRKRECVRKLPRSGFQKWNGRTRRGVAGGDASRFRHLCVESDFQPAAEQPSILDLWMAASSQIVNRPPK